MEKLELNFSEIVNMKKLEEIMLIRKSMKS